MSGIDYLVFSGHKVYAPFSTSVLIARKGLPTMKPADMALAEKYAVENAGRVAALAHAKFLLDRIGYEAIIDHEKKLLQKTIETLPKIPGIRFFGLPDTTATQIENRTAVLVFEIKNKMNSKQANNLAHNGGIGSRFGCH